MRVWAPPGDTLALAVLDTNQELDPYIRIFSRLLSTPGGGCFSSRCTLSAFDRGASAVLRFIFS